MFAGLRSVLCLSEIAAVRWYSLQNSASEDATRLLCLRRAVDGEYRTP